MGLSLKATKGPLTGQNFRVQNGITLGRQGATINLGDPRASSIHARILEKGGRWLLEDNESKNGIRDAQGERVESMELKPGSIFAIGESSFVVEHTKIRGEPPPPSPTDAAPAPFTPAAAAVASEKPKSKKRQILWNEALADFIENNAKKFRDKVKPVHPLSPALILEFVRGSQVNSRWVIGFGPRRIGSACLDLPIWEPGAPPICFEIFPGPDGLMFKTAHRDVVKLNGQAVDSGVLRVGDTIAINDTLIEVDFTE